MATIPMLTSVRAGARLTTGAVLLMIWLASAPAAADQFEAPAQVQAQLNGEFRYLVRLIVGPAGFQIASFGSWDLANTDVGFIGDCFCEPYCVRVPGDTVRFEVSGALVDTTAIGMVGNYISGCQAGGGSGTTVILPMPTTDVASGAWSHGFRVSNAPNPCRDRTVFYYSLPESGPTELQIFDASGRLVATPLRGIGAPGSHTVTWNRADAEGERLPNGMYLARFVFKGHARVLRIPVID